MNKSLFHLSIVATAFLGAACTLPAAESNPYVGRWALTLPGGGAGWLGVTRENGYYDAGILWGGGSVMPASAVFFMEDNLYVIRNNEVKRKGPDGKVVRTHVFPEVLLCRLSGDTLSLARMVPNANGEGMHQEELSGKRIPDLPPAPDLSKVKFGDAITLFNGKDLDGWRLVESGARNGWRAENGLLVNDPKQEDGKPHVNYGNLRTDREFEDFRLTLEVSVPKNGNSGIYLRGIYEIQVADTHGRPLDSHNMGGLYSRITPAVSAEKPAGEWQTFDITLVDRHLTVILNGKTLIDNQPVLGCTGGALWSDESKPGPIYFQGDHEAVTYRNIVLRPAVR